MSSSDFDHLFEDFSPAAPPVPGSLLEAALRHAGTTRADRNHALRARVLLAAAAIVALVAASFTPPGRAAADWLRDVAGFGEEPTLNQVGSVEGTAVVVDSGQLSDGNPYEAVIKRLDLSRFEDGPGGVGQSDRRLPNLVCLQIDWIETQGKGQGGLCTQGNESDDPLSQSAATLFTRPGSAADSPGLFYGYVDNPNIVDIRVVQDTEVQSELPVRVIEISGDLRNAIGLPFPSMVFIAPIEGDVVMAGEDGEAQVTATGLDAGGRPIGEVKAFTPPFGCDELDPVEPTPPPPAGTPPPRPLTDAEIAAPPSCPGVEQGSGSVSQYRLDEDPLPGDVLRGATSAGFPLSPAEPEDYPPLYDPDSDASSVDEAARTLSQGAVQELLSDSVGIAVRGSAHIYLARLEQDDRLVYAGTFTALGFTGPDEPDPKEVGGLPATFIGIFDVATGEKIASERVEP